MQTRIVSFSFIARLGAIACLPIFAMGLPGSLHAQQSSSAPATPLEIRGHHIGEPIKLFFRLEREARDEVEVCNENPGRPACSHLLDAVEFGKRAELSTSVAADLDHPEGDRETTDWVLDGGKLVKISMLVNEARGELKSLGRPSSEKSIPSQNSSGAKWENHLTEWRTPSLFVSLYQDNNPSLHDHRLSLTIESPSEHARDNPDADPPKPPAPPSAPASN
ncbi:MAG: hypothetical protein WB987_05195 [Candidatus Acidiferrales bacterium]